MWRETDSSGSDYGEKGFEYLDIGISTDHGIINYGLSDFKISIGCDTSAKVTFVKDYSKNSVVDVISLNGAAEGTFLHNKNYLKRMEVKQ